MLYLQMLCPGQIAKFCHKKFHDLKQQNKSAKDAIDFIFWSSFRKDLMAACTVHAFCIVHFFLMHRWIRFVCGLFIAGGYIIRGGFVGVKGH